MAFLVGVPGSFPIYRDKVYENATLNGSNIAECFDVTNENYYFAASGDTFVNNNQGIQSTNAITTWTAKYNTSLTFTMTASNWTYDGGEYFYYYLNGSMKKGFYDTGTSTYTVSLVPGDVIKFEVKYDNYDYTGVATLSNIKATFTGKEYVQTLSEVGFAAKDIWIGDANGIARKVNKIWVGDTNGIARRAFATYTEKIFQSSTTFTIPDNVTAIDIFCVGGGGGGGGWLYYRNWDTPRERYYYGTAGAGGYTKTLLNQAVTPGDTLTITIGAAGTSGKYYIYDDGSTDGTATSASGLTAGGNGGASSVALNGTTIITANGGNGGKKVTAINSGAYTNKPSVVSGANGGSGSSVHYFYYNYKDSTISGRYPQFSFGFNGQDGYKSLWYTCNASSSDGETYIYNDGDEAWTDFTKGTAGKGQGYTTGEWGDENNIWYSYSGRAEEFASWFPGYDSSLYPPISRRAIYGNGADADHSYDAYEGVVIIRYISNL